jgi:hypothetical protein
VVITYFSPLQAVWFTFLLSWLCASMLGLIIYVLNIVTRTKYIGTVLSACLVTYSCFVDAFGNKKMLKYSPVSWVTLDKVDVGGKTANPSFFYCVTFYIMVSVIMITIVFVYNKFHRIEVS